MKQTTFGASINVDEYLFREERISPIACSFACTAITDHHHVMHAALTYFRKEVSRQASRFQGQVFAIQRAIQVLAWVQGGWIGDPLLLGIVHSLPESPSLFCSPRPSGFRIVYTGC